MDNRKLPIPIYLNQRVVFDMLAIIQDGFSNLKTVRTKSEKTNEKGASAETEIGTSNIFAFLNLNLKGNVSGSKQKVDGQEIEQEKSYTPAALFSIFRESLIDNKTLKVIDENYSVDSLKNGDFVEFSGVLNKNPMVSFLESIIQLMETAFIFDEKPKGKNNQEKRTLDQMKKFVSKIVDSGNLDLFTVIDDHENIKAVVPVQLEYFENQRSADILDGNFKVLGKIVRVVKDDNDSINLLRSTPMAMLPESMLSEFTNVFTQAEDSINFSGEFKTKIEGPAILVIPIAIYA